MAFRTFRDSSGTEWSAWDVTPGAVERRIADRRMLAEPTPEERRESDRRLRSGEPAALSSTFPPSWLCFEGGVERRRLMRVPAGWADCSDAELERFRDEARPVRSLRYNRDGLPAK